MSTQQPKPHPHRELILEWANKVASGEVAAGWWICQFGYQGEWTNVDPNKGEFPWRTDLVYRIVKGPNFPQIEREPLMIWRPITIYEPQDMCNVILWGRNCGYDIRTSCNIPRPFVPASIRHKYVGTVGPCPTHWMPLPSPPTA